MATQSTTLTRPHAVDMVWHDLLFAHWPVDALALRRLIPAALKIDTHQGQAYIGVIPFHMSGVRRRICPRVPMTHTFAELNVRTYVTDGDKPGVWFFSLDAASRLAVWTARRWYHLNYQLAKMSVTHQADGWIGYASSRRKPGGLRSGASQSSARGLVEFRGRYRGVGEPFRADEGSLDDWLTGRFCLYTSDRRGRVYRGDIEHEPWRLQRGEAEIEVNTMTEPLGIELEGEPHLLYAQRMDTRAWTLKRIT